MRTQQFIDLIRFNPLYTELDNLLRTDNDTFYRRKLDTYINKVWTHREMVFHFRYGSMVNHLPHLSTDIKFNYAGVDVVAYLYIGIDDFSRKKAVIETSLRFYSSTHYRLFDKIDTMELPLSLNLDNPVRQLKKILNKFIMPEGYFSDVQLMHQCTINEIKDYANPLMNYKNPVDYDFTKAELWIEKHFNLEPNGYLYEAIALVNKHGRYEKPAMLGVFDRSFADYLDGDADELENAFWDEMEQYPKNMIFIN